MANFPPHDAIVSLVAAVQRRMRRRRALRRLLWGASIGLVAALCVLAVEKWTGMSPAWSKATPFIGAVAGALAFLVIPWRRRVAQGQAVKLADERLDLHDQLVNAFEFIRARREDPLAELTIEQTASRIGAPGAASKVTPARFPAALCALVLTGAACWGAQHALFAPQERRQVEVTNDLGASLLNFAAGSADADDQQFKKSVDLMNELKMLSDKASKEEILARLSRMIQEADSSDDAAMKGRLKKLQEDFAQGELRRQVQEELDKPPEEVAVVDDSGGKVTAEPIKVLDMVDKREKQAELAGKIKEVATEIRKQAQEDKKKVAEWTTVPETPTPGKTKEVKQTVTSDKDLGKLVENRDILHMILTAAADRVRSGENYRTVYENYRRIMRAFLFSQDLPSGEQEYVERYFKVIKPRETKPEK